MPADSTAVTAASSKASKKLTLNVSPMIADRLDEMARRRGITVTELIRRSIGIYGVIDKALETHDELQIVTKDSNDVIHQLDLLTT